MQVVVVADQFKNLKTPLVAMVGLVAVVKE
jgi:hypothetical protein